MIIAIDYYILMVPLLRDDEILPLVNALTDAIMHNNAMAMINLLIYWYRVSDR